VLLAARDRVERGECRMIGAENTAFPRRYVAIGMPMLFAFAYVDDSDPTTTSPQGRCQRSFAITT
jgi:hypothetical protein